MKKISFLSALISIYFLFGAHKANADLSQCNAVNISARLHAFCLVSLANGGAYSMGEVVQVDRALKNIGFEEGLNLGDHYQTPRPRFSYSIKPTVYYSPNINGGNPHKDFKIGEITFEGDSALTKVSGTIAAVIINGNGKHNISPGRYLDYGFSLESGKALSSNFRSQNTQLYFCSNNHIYNWWFFDFCLEASKNKKSLNDNSNNQVSLGFSKPFLASDDSYNLASIIIKTEDISGFIQNQLEVSFETLLREGASVRFGLIRGDYEGSRHLLKSKAYLDSGLVFFGKPTNIFSSYSKSHESKFLNLSRKDETYTLSLSTPLSDKASISIGMEKTRSSIDYFDDEFPILLLKFEL